MTSKFPFRPDSPYSDFLKLQREQADMVKNILGPTTEFQRRLAAVQRPLAHLRELEKTGILGTAARMSGTRIGEVMAASEALRLSKISALKDFASPNWMVALQGTARWIDRDPGGILKTQKAILVASVPEWTKLGSVFAANQSTISKLLGASRWAEQARTLSEQLSPSLEIIKIAADRARMIDGLTLRAAADTVATSSAAIAAEQVLEAHRLIEAIGQSESPEQGAGLLIALVTLMAAIVQRFGENTMKEIGGIGALKLFEIFMVVLAFVQWMTPPDMSPAEMQAIVEIKAELQTIEDRIEELLQAQEAAHEASVADMPRAELKRMAPIRREPQGKAQVLMRGDEGMLLAVKENRGTWRLVVYRDPLTDQLSEGWVYAPAVRLLDAPG
ncbi:SH3 domain-containing protein [Sphingomonas sp. HF-S3]|uniref:SH3 domain-containing protein n=1 Tax=Sphingomonas rustica TaxID=3103142 RepID=A0ABV0BD30_9SPHN